jgi:hypothetical protein
MFNIEQDRQCTCNVTLRRVHETIVAGEKQKNITDFRENVSACVHTRACVCGCSDAGVC